GLIRESGVSPLHKSVPLKKMTFSVFVPKKRLLGRRTPDYRWVLESVPLAIQFSAGSFQKSVEEEALKVGIKLNIRLGCESFPQACRAVLSGDYAAILPTFAAVDLQSASFKEIPLPLLKAHE